MPGAVPQRQSYQPQDEEEEEEAEEESPGYRLYRDPRTGRVYAAYEQPKLPPETSTGRRVRMAPPREQLDRPGFYGAPSRPQRKMPGYEFVEDTLQKELMRRQQQQQQAGRSGDPYDILKQLARGYMLNDEYGKAQRSLSDAYAQDSGRMDDEMLTSLGETEHRRGRLTEASKYYQQALQQNEQNSRWGGREAGGRRSRARWTGC